jgi:DNA-binding LytR/AlgR family response regulator
MEELQKSKIDIIFLDINLPEITGIEFLKSTPNLPMIIFTTAYNNYAIEGFNLNAVDYLLKPFSFERFLQAANKCFHINKMNQKQTIDSAANHSEFIFVRCNNEDIKINLDTIVRINGLKDYVIIHTLDNKYIVHSTLKAILEK